MKFACKCLNIDLTGMNLRVTTIDYRTTGLELPLFDEDLVLVDMPAYVHKVPALIEVVKVGVWIAYRCACCNTWVYAQTTTMGMGYALVDKSCRMDKNTFESLIKSEFYSNTFKIILKHETSDATKLDDPLDSLTAVAINWLNDQALITEERVKLFCEYEYDRIDKIRSKLVNDQIVLQRLMEKFNKEVRPEPTLRNRPVEEQEPEEREKAPSPAPYDGEIFVMEDIFEPRARRRQIENGDHDPEYVEWLEEDENVPENVLLNAMSTASSVPIPVPAFLDEAAATANARAREKDDETPKNIAESIKELADSIRGDSIFGELPRPRLSSNI